MNIISENCCLTSVLVVSLHGNPLVRMHMGQRAGITMDGAATMGIIPTQKTSRKQWRESVIISWSSLNVG